MTSSKRFSEARIRSKWPIIGIYITHEDKKGHINYVSFHALEEAKAWLKHIQTTHGIPDPDKNDLIFESGWKISTRDNSDYNDLPQLLRDSQGITEVVPAHVLQRFGITRTQPSLPAQEVPQKSALPRTKRESKDGLILLKDIHPSPSEARALLRQAKIPKPSTGWSWPPDSQALKEVKKVLKIT